MRRLRLTRDRTTLNIVALVIGAMGIYGALSETGVPMPDVHATYFDGNRAAFKREIIANCIAVHFAWLAIAGIAIEALMEVFGLPKDEHKSPWWWCNIAVLVLVTLAWWPISAGLIRSAKTSAHAEWEPEVVSKMRPAFEHAHWLVMHEGQERPENAAVLSDEQIRAERLKSTAQDIGQIERLLDSEARAIFSLGWDGSPASSVLSEHPIRLSGSDYPRRSKPERIVATLMPTLRAQLRIVSSARRVQPKGVWCTTQMRVVRGAA